MAMWTENAPRISFRGQKESTYSLLGSRKKIKLSMANRNQKRLKNLARKERAQIKRANRETAKRWSPSGAAVSAGSSLIQ